MNDRIGFSQETHDSYRPRFDAGESMDDLAREAGISRPTMWRRIGRPARYLVRSGEAPSPSFVAWAAGFFDGEGSVSVKKGGNIQVIVAQTVREPLDAYVAAFGGSVNAKTPGDPRHKQVYWWRLGGARALEFLRLVRPLLRVKGAVADLALASLARPSRRGCPLTPDEIAQRTELFLTAKALNHRGRA